MNFRNTPKADAPAPSQLLMSRNLRTMLPCNLDHLKPKLADSKKYNQILQKRKESMISQSPNVKPLRELKVNENVMFKKKPNELWLPATVVNKCKEPNSYIIRTPDGATYRRNRLHIKTRPKKVSFSFEDPKTQIENNNFCQKSVKTPTQEYIPLLKFPLTSQKPAVSHINETEFTCTQSPPVVTIDSDSEYSTPQTISNHAAIATTTPVSTSSKSTRGRGRGLIVNKERSPNRRKIVPPRRYSP